jgi:acyl-CoA synthetase (AMP-forming)/AMP-acid ligase II
MTRDGSPRDLLSLLTGLADRDPAAPMAIDRGPDATHTVSRRELWLRTMALREDLRGHGVGERDCVAVYLPNWSDALAWQFATASLGAHVIGINTRYNVEEVVHVLDRARPKVLAAAHGFHKLDLSARLHRAARHARVQPPSVAVVTGPGQPPPDDPSAYDVGSGSWLPTPPAEDYDSVPATSGDELAVAFTTSGSTGRPKLAAHVESAVVSHALADAAAIDARDGDVMLCVLPLSGVFGFSTAMAALAAGAACLLEPLFDEDAVVADMERFGVTHAVGADDIVTRLADGWRRSHADLSAWRWLGIADFLGKVGELATWARDEFGTTTAGVYGSSELFALASLWPPDEPAPRRWSAGGRVVSPEIEVRVVDPESEQALGAGERGELQFRGPNVVDDYLGDPDAVERAFTSDGWFRTGDLGELADDGSIQYVCRMGDVLRLRGFLVEPAEIEHRLAAHEAVQTVKVVGIRDGGGQTEAIGFVVLRDGRSADPDELRAWCAQVLANFKVPKVVHVIEEMPTTAGTNGTKIRTAALREWARRLETEPEWAAR